MANSINFSIDFLVKYFHVYNLRDVFNIKKNTIAKFDSYRNSLKIFEDYAGVAFHLEFSSHKHFISELEDESLSKGLADYFVKDIPKSDYSA